MGKATAKGVNVCIMRTEGDKREKGTEAIFEAIMTDNFFQINVKHQNTRTGS